MSEVTQFEDVVQIAHKVNLMPAGQMRIRIRQLEQLYNQNNLTFRQHCELQYLLLKILSNPSEYE